MEQLQSSHPRWDKEVCERLVAGDEAALGELYDELSPLVYGLAARVTRDWAAAEDITQEVFVRVWENPQAFDPALKAKVEVLPQAPDEFFNERYMRHLIKEKRGVAVFLPTRAEVERLGQELAVVTFKEYALQDGNTLEATQSMLESRAVTEFPLCDQEVILRHLHTTAKAWVAEHQPA